MNFRIARYTLLMVKIATFFLALLLVTTSVSAKTLEAGVEIQDFVKPIPAPLQIGETFQESKIPPVHTVSRFVRIPRWMAGTWLKEAEADESGRQRKSKQEVRFGSQTDRTGAVWHFISTPKRSVTKHKDDLTYYQVNSIQVKVDGDSVIVRKEGQCWHVDRRSHIVKEAGQSVEINTYRDDGTGKSLHISHYIDYSHQDARFDQTDRETWKYKLQKPYKPVLHLLPKFTSFLSANGLSDRVPRSEW